MLATSLDQLALDQLAEAQLALAQLALAHEALAQLALDQFAVLATTEAQLAWSNAGLPVTASVVTNVSRFSFAFGGSSRLAATPASISPTPPDALPTCGRYA